MAGKDNKKTVETLTRDEVRRRHIPTAEYQSVVRKEEEEPICVAYELLLYCRLKRPLHCL